MLAKSKTGAGAGLAMSKPEQVQCWQLRIASSGAALSLGDRQITGIRTYRSTARAGGRDRRHGGLEWA